MDLNSLYETVKSYKCRFSRRSQLSRILAQEEVKIYYGCGHASQDGYVNVDIRWTPTVDLMADLQWCQKHLTGSCDEVFLSHVLEHYEYPGKVYRDGPNTVPRALRCIFNMLKPGGIIRLAVPDLRVLLEIYFEGNHQLYPKLLGRIYGEQNYRENLHKCGFDHEFLCYCLKKAGFTEIERWSPEEMKLKPDASFDAIDGRVTSLNLLARKDVSFR